MPIAVHQRGPARCVRKVVVVVVGTVAGMLTGMHFAVTSPPTDTTITAARSADTIAAQNQLQKLPPVEAAQRALLERTQAHLAELKPSSNSPAWDPHCVKEAISGGSESEKSPLVISQANLTVCRVAKGGSLLVRSLIYSYFFEEPFRVLPNIPTQQNAPTLGQLTDPIHVLATHRRIMFVRHPVTRTLSGWLQNGCKLHSWVAHKGACTPTRFKEWLHGEFTQDYDANCGAATLAKDSTTWKQHWAPPQHCKCGMPCGVPWEMFKVEQHPVQSILGPLLNFTAASVPLAVHSGNYHGLSKAEFLPAPVLQFLNYKTKQEQLHLGYEPFSTQ